MPACGKTKENLESGRKAGNPLEKEGMHVLGKLSPYAQKRGNFFVCLLRGNPVYRV